MRVVPSFFILLLSIFASPSHSPFFPSYFGNEFPFPPSLPLSLSCETHLCLRVYVMGVALYPFLHLSAFSKHCIQYISPFSQSMHRKKVSCDKRTVTKPSGVDERASHQAGCIMLQVAEHLHNLTTGSSAAQPAVRGAGTPCRVGGAPKGRRVPMRGRVPAADICFVCWQGSEADAAAGRGGNACWAQRRATVQCGVHGGCFCRDRRNAGRALRLDV